MTRLVVVGNGMAGGRFVEDVVARAPGLFDVTVVGEEPCGSYNRVLLSGVLAGTHDPRSILMRDEAWYAVNGVRLVSGNRAARVDREARVVVLDDGTACAYDTLVLATGSAPFVPPIGGLAAADGSPKRGVFVFRTLADCERIASWARASRRAVVLGGGLLGLEAARGLSNLGPEVHVVHLGAHLMDTQLDACAGSMLETALRRLGLHLHLGKATTALRGDASVTGLAFEDGSSLDCDMVVISAGIRPNVALAREAGLAVKRGIVVGDDLASIDDGAICAVGECAEHRGRVYGLVAPAWEQAAALADRLTGRAPQASYAGSNLSTKLKVMGVDLAVMGEKNGSGDDEVVTYAEPRRGVYKKLVVRDGRLAGAILLGDGESAPAVVQAFDRGTPLPHARAEILFPGAGDRPPAAEEISELPDDARICHCNGVSKGALVAAMGRGCLTVEALGRATRAGTGCGSCKPQLARLLAAPVASAAVS